MMVQDSITWTGARAPGVERRTSLAWRCSTEQVAPTLNGEPMLLRRTRRVVANLIHAMGMLGASLTEAESGKALSDMPALEKLSPQMPAGRPGCTSRISAQARRGV